MPSSYLPRLEQFQTFLFDCDGVILDSNSIKTDAFARLAAPFGESVQTELVNYHLINGGVSRFEKVKYLVCELLNREPNSSLIAELVTMYGHIVADGLLSCGECAGIRPHLERLRALPGKIHVVSGGLECELQQLFLARGLDVFFDTINGSPRDKFQIINDLQSRGQINGRAIFFGDSRQDHLASARAGADFVFVARYTEMPGWEVYVREHGPYVCHDLTEFDLDVSSIQ